MKRKGFTLIELLAVIIILAVIALIATPVVLNVIENSRNEARKDSVIGYADAVRLSYAEEQLTNTGKPLDELATQKMTGEEVACTKVIYNDKYGTMLHDCNVEEIGNYCYFRGNVYEGETEECKTVEKIINDGTIPYNNPVISTVSQQPSNTTYAQSKEIKIEFPSLKIVEEHYYIKVSDSITINNVVSECGISGYPTECKSSTTTVLEPGTWYEVSGEVIFATTQNMSIESVIGSDSGFGDRILYTESSIDTSEPEANVSSVSVKTDSITVVADCKDLEAGITKYEYSKDNGTTWIDNKTNNSYTFTGLEQNKEYTFTIRCTNGSNLTTTTSKSATTSSVEAPTISQTSQTPSSGDYATERIVTVTYNSNGIENPEYYLKTTTPVTVSSSNIIATCGTGTVPGECVSTNELAAVGAIAENDNITLAINTWYKTNNEKVDVTFTSNGALFAQTKDATGNVADAMTYTVVNIDTTEPSVSASTGTIKTDRIEVIATCEDLESGISKYEYSKDNGTTWVTGTTSSYIFTGLIQNKEYTFKVRCTNGSALTKETSKTAETLSITAPTIAQTSQTPSSGTTYVQERIIRITYSGTNIENPKYYYSLDGTNWTQVTSTTKDLTFTSNGKVYAKTTDDAENIASASTYTVANIDSTEPSASVSSISVKTDRATVTASCSDPESGITKYEYSSDNGSTWNSNGTTATYTFTGLTQTKEYTFAVRCTNGSALTKTGSKKATTSTITVPTIAQQSQTPSSGTYAQERVIRITYSAANIQNPKYYYSLDGTNWTQVTTTTKDLTFTANGKVYAKTTDDAGNTKSASTYTVANIDTAAPTVSVSVTGKVATITLKDNIGVVGYGVNQSNSTEPSYTGITSTTNTSKTWTALSAGTYYAWVKDGAGRTAKVAFTVSSNAYLNDATSAHILSGKTAWVNGVKLTGTMTNKSGTTTSASTITTSGTNALITIPASGYYDITSKLSVPITTIKTQIGSSLSIKTTNISNVSSNIGTTSAFYYGADTDALFLGVNTWTATGTGYMVDLSTLTSTTSYSMFYQASWGSEYSFTMTVNPSTRRVTLNNTDGNVVGRVTEITVN